MAGAPGEPAVEHLRNALLALQLLVVEPALPPALVPDVAAIRDRLQAGLERVEEAAAVLRGDVPRWRGVAHLLRTARALLVAGPVAPDASTQPPTGGSE